MLEAKGVSTAVVSMPITELFDEQPQEYKDKVLGKGMRVSIEAASSYGWSEYTGPRGKNFGLVEMGYFGVVANIHDGYSNFGLRADLMAYEIEEGLNRQNET